MTEVENVKFGALTVAEGVNLSTNRTLVRVTNVLTPYFIRICKAERFQKTVDAIAKELWVAQSKWNLKSNTTNDLPKLGDFVIIDGTRSQYVDLPSWSCRGIISGMDIFRKKFKIMLTDYGTCVHLQKGDFTVVSKDFICKDHLSQTIGLYNILPASATEKSHKGKVTHCVISQEWSQEAIEFTKDLLSMSNEVYYNYLASDELSREYGDLYLNIDGDIISLRQALVLSNHAVYLENLLEFIKNPNVKNCQKIEPKTEEKEAVFHVDLSTVKIDNGGDGLTRNTKNVAKDSFQADDEEKLQVETERQRVLIYGSSKFECLTSVYEAKFPTGIHEAWNTVVRSRRPKKIQSYVWPAIKKGHDVVAIGPPKSGKTFGYAVAISAALAAIESQLPRGNNASALILCSSSMEVLNVHSLCTELLLSYKNVNSVALVYNKSDRSSAAEIFNGCQILISTPSFLLRFLERNKELVNFENLRYIVFDEAVDASKKYHRSVTELLKKRPTIRRRISRTNKKCPVQIILIAEHWTSLIKETIYCLTNSPFICITSFIEAAIFKSVRSKIYATHSENKKKTVSGLLVDYKVFRTIIICINAEEAEDLNSFLTNEETLLAHENMDLITLQGIKERWHISMTEAYPLLICTDQVLSEMDVTNIDHLIHYSISLALKRPFNFRFSTLLQNLRKEKPDCRVTIVADEQNDLQFLSIVRIMQRMNVTIPKSTLQFLERIDVTLEKRKENFSICERLLSFGVCHKRNTCCFRHCVLPEIDEPRTQIAINDTVKLMVIYVHDATHFSARVISYVKSDTQEVVEFPGEEYLKLPMKMQEYYSSVNNRKRSQAVNVGEIYTLDDTINSFRRVEVIRQRTDEMGSLKDVELVDLRCIDSGVIFRRVKANRLLEIPAELSKLPTPVVEVFLTGIVPCDEEIHWNQWTVDAVHEWFEENIDERSFVTATIKLHLRNILLVDTLEIRTKIVGCDETIATSLKKELLSTDHGIENGEHVQNLYKLCQDGGFGVFY